MDEREKDHFIARMNSVTRRRCTAQWIEKGRRVKLTWPVTRVFPEATALLVLVCATIFCQSAQGQCEVQQLHGDTKDLDNDFGQTVAICGDVAVVGDTLPCSYPSSCAGVVYVFRVIG